MAYEQTKIWLAHGGDTETFESGAVLDLKTGSTFKAAGSAEFSGVVTIAATGVIDVLAGGVMKAAGTQAAAIAALTHAVGTADGTIDDVGGAFNQATLNNNFKELSAKVNAALSAIRGVGIIAP